MLRTLETEMAGHKYAHVERERRWLVHPDRAPALDGLAHVRIEDRYIEGTRLRLRRMTDSASGTVALKLGKKYECADPLARPMVTTYLTPAEYALLATLPARSLAKARYTLPGAAGLFSLDRFEGPLEGLALIEIEMPDDASLRALDTPGWAGRDVSADPAYEGGTLARHGLPQESPWPSF
jgi:CYTH domain-containing protein